MNRDIIFFNRGIYIYEIKLQIYLRIRRIRRRQIVFHFDNVWIQQRAFRLSISDRRASDAVSVSASISALHHQPAADRRAFVFNLERIKGEK